MQSNALVSSLLKVSLLKVSCMTALIQIPVTLFNHIYQIDDRVWL